MLKDHSKRLLDTPPNAEQYRGTQRQHEDDGKLPQVAMELPEVDIEAIQ